MGEVFRIARSIGLSFIAAALLLSVAPGRARAATPFLGPLARPNCHPGDRTETGLDGQLTAAERASGAATRPYNCNLAIVGEYAGQGAGHQLMWYGHCAYVTTEGYEAGQKGVPPLEHPGIQVLDVTHQRDPRYRTHLDDPASLYDWEDGSVNPRRALLGSAESWMGAGPQPAVSFYDLSDCAHPQLLSSVQIPDPELQAHAGNFAYDGKTYWIASFNKRRLYAIDLTDPRHPREIIDWDFPHGEAGGAQAHQICHRISLNQFAVDGHPPDTLLFCGVVGHLVHAGDFSSGNGLVIYDVSQVQQRRPHPAIRVLGSLYWTDGDIAIEPDLAFIAGRPYLAIGDECGSGGCDDPQGAIAACRAGLPPNGLERLIDISDLAKPKLVARLMLGVDDPRNCALTEHDITATMGGYGYSVHDCTFDNPLDAKLLACSSHQAGVRVFDIHDPYRPREIAYFKGPAPADPSQIDPGSLLNVFQGVGPPINFAWSKAHSRFLWRGGRLYLWVTSSHGGFYTLRFEDQAAIARLKPVPTPGNEDYQD
ncbi:MAG: LVIVD repeat-containing protein [Steroidobacteraceae bacterium]